MKNLENVCLYKDLVEKQANLLHSIHSIDTMKRQNYSSSKQEKVEIQRQEMEVIEWLAMASTETTPATDQEYYASKIAR